MRNLNIAKRTAICVFALIAAGCNPATETSVTKKSVDQTDESQASNVLFVEASCGQCQFGLPGDGCDLAVRIEGQAYFVDGAKIDDHGDAHADDGLCNAVRQARVTGKVENGRFIATSFRLLPIDEGRNTEY